MSKLRELASCTDEEWAAAGKVVAVAEEAYEKGRADARRKLIEEIRAEARMLRETFGMDDEADTLEIEATRLEGKSDG